MDKTSKKIDIYLGNDYLIGKLYYKGMCTKIAADDPRQGFFQNSNVTCWDLAFHSAMSVSSTEKADHLLY